MLPHVRCVQRNRMLSECGPEPCAKMRSSCRPHETRLLRGEKRTRKRVLSCCLSGYRTNKKEHLDRWKKRCVTSTRDSYLWKAAPLVTVSQTENHESESGAASEWPACNISTRRPLDEAAAGRVLARVEEVKAKSTSGNKVKSSDIVAPGSAKRLRRASSAASPQECKAGRAAAMTGALAGVEECHQATEKSQFLCWRKPGVPSGLPSQRFAISVRIRFGLSLRDQELFSSIPRESLTAS